MKYSTMLFYKEINVYKQDDTNFYDTRILTLIMIQFLLLELFMIKEYSF